ncbi:winged helix-turn-helix domain-containing protein [Granulicella sp. S156]|uniref:winged helix-turn-helix domain-containing protein n=1 Tax=Granulicella sp. S156 TaxID=1747224 RepID=UPI0020B174BB|nr:winged helix-turn-helix domain-containing protein [Granulicella sp. S156]
MAVLQETNRIAFGRFEADLQSGELWKGSLRIHLPAQPFKVLCTLLEKPGEVVSKEELQDRLWGKDTNVDFERAIAGAINKIRDALGDSAESPRYIETLPKRGYRFVATVTTLTGPARSLLPTTNMGDRLSETDEDSAVVTRPVEESAMPQRTGLPLIPETRSSRYRVVALFAVILGQFILLIWLLARQSAPASPEIDQITDDSPISEGPPNQENLPSLATDGASIFATARVNGKPQLAAIPIGTGDLRPVPLPQELAPVSIADVSRDGSKLLLLSRLTSATEQPLWIAPTAGGSAFRVGNILAHAATWMPDGASILYASGNDLSLVRMSDGESIRLSTLPGRAFWPRWSPDGKLLRFTMMDPMTHTSSLWEMASGSSSAHALPGFGSDHSPMCCGVWTPDGKSYVFQAYREHGSDLWELSHSFGRSRLERLTQGPIHYFSPIAARSGRRIFFLGSDVSNELQRFDQKQHAFLPERSFLRGATRVEYSPDGSSIVWTDSDGGLWRAHAWDGSDRLQLAPPEYEVFAAHWSPDGTRLALMARRRGHPWSIYLESATGSQLTPLLNENHNAADPTWSPDGKQIVFGREPDLMGKEAGPREIYLLDVQSGKIEVLPGSEGLFSPRWSPDGQWIAALSLDQRKVMLYNWHTRTWSLLAETSAADPVWSRDSKALYVHAFLADEQPILRISMPTGEAQVIADLSDTRLKDAENYFFSGLTPNNEPLILPRVGTSNLYSLDLDH